MDPEIPNYDEPFSALDPLIRREMQDELIDIQNRVHKTMIFITHNFLEAIKKGDHISVMKDGEISKIGTPEELVANPLDDYVRDFTEDVPRYKVLSTGKVMREATKRDSGPKCNVNAKLESLIDLACESSIPLKVMDDDSQLVGEIDQSMIVRAMNSCS